MPPVSTSIAIARLVEQARATPGLDALLLFGSRARRDAHAGSDWDLAYLGSGGFDVEAFLGQTVAILGTDRVDLVDLGRASGLLRFRVARDGELLHEARPGITDDFRLEAARFWCDAEPVLRRGYHAVLADLTS